MRIKMCTNIDKLAININFCKQVPRYVGTLKKNIEENKNVDKLQLKLEINSEVIDIISPTE